MNRGGEKAGRSAKRAELKDQSQGEKRVLAALWFEEGL
jgi:hypothetical protein